MKNKLGFSTLITLFVWWGGLPITAQSETIDMGYWLDQAVVACAKKDEYKLDIIENKINALIKATPRLERSQHYLFKLLKAFKSGRCHLPNSNSQTVLSVNNGGNKQKQKNNTELYIATGFSDNINNGVKHSEISVNSAFSSEKVVLTLGEDSLPLSDIFYSLKLSHNFALSDKYDVYLDVGSQEYKENKKYSFSSVKFGLLSMIPSSPIVYDISVGGVWLEGELWEKNIKFKAAVPLYKDKSNKLTLNGALKNSWYLFQNPYRAVKFEVGGKYERRLSNKALIGAFIGVGKDAVHSESRAGGDKASQELRASAQYKVTPRVTVEAQASQESYQDSLPYSLALFGSVRRQLKKEALALYLKTDLGKNSWADLSYVRSKQEDDNIALVDTPWGDYVNVGFGYRW